MLRPVDKPLGARSLPVAEEHFEVLRRGVRKKALVRQGARLIAQLVLLFALAAVLFFRIPEVEGRSMLPGIGAGNHVLINTLAYGLTIGRITVARRSVGRFDIVSFEQGVGDDRKVLLKRVVGLPGERIGIVDGQVMINGVLLREDYRHVADRTEMASLYVPFGSVFVLGDNRGESEDSRSFGPIPTSSIFGKAVFTIWPIANLKEIH